MFDSFNSLQAGNFFQTSRRRFLFYENSKVSIPFKRETSSKLGGVQSFPLERWFCFNSLQAGNFFQTTLTIRSSRAMISFQFPSSGKLLPNVNIDALELTLVPQSFNSLQAGNFFQTTLTIRSSRAMISFQFPSSGKLLPNRLLRRTKKKSTLCFNSLQAGNFFQTQHHRIPYQQWSRVSIPFKRETSSKRQTRICKPY